MPVTLLGTADDMRRGHGGHKALVLLPLRTRLRTGDTFDEDHGGCEEEEAFCGVWVEFVVLAESPVPSQPRQDAYAATYCPALAGPAEQFLPLLGASNQVSLKNAMGIPQHTSVPISIGTVWTMKMSPKISRRETMPNAAPKTSCRRLLNKRATTPIATAPPPFRSAVRSRPPRENANANMIAIASTTLAATSKRLKGRGTPFLSSIGPRNIERRDSRDKPPAP